MSDLRPARSTVGSAATAEPRSAGWRGDDEPNTRRRDKASPSDCRSETSAPQTSSSDATSRPAPPIRGDPPHPACEHESRLPPHGTRRPPPAGSVKGGVAAPECPTPAAAAADTASPATAGGDPPVPAGARPSSHRRLIPTPDTRVRRDHIRRSWSRRSSCPHRPARWFSGTLAQRPDHEGKHEERAEGLLPVRLRQDREDGRAQVEGVVVRSRRRGTADGMRARRRCRRSGRLRRLGRCRRLGRLPPSRPEQPRREARPPPGRHRRASSPGRRRTGRAACRRRPASRRGRTAPACR